MAIKPILFNTQMVRAILEGRKKTTRRVIKAKGYDITGIPSWAMFRRNPDDFFFDVCKTGKEPSSKTATTILIEPPARPGDFLWVRETWNYGYVETSDAEGCNESWFEELRKPASGYLGALSRYFYVADKDDEQIMSEIGGKWRPSIHMPREAARLLLKVKDVQAERLQDMTEEDAICEGYDGMPWCYHHVFENYQDSPIPCDASSGYDCPPDRPCDKSIPELFGETIWNSTIKQFDLHRYGWDANPFVWVMDFERIELPENWN